MSRSDDYKRRKDKGMCADCSAPAEEGYVRCAPCRKERNEINNRHYHKVVKHRILDGKCRACDERAEEGKTYCRKHLDEMMAWAASPGGRFYKAQWHSKRRLKGKVLVVWGFTQEEYEAVVADPCYYCGLPNDVKTCIGMDRLDNAFGYVKGNVVSCCWDCNMARRDRFTVEQMKKFIGPAIREAKLFAKGLLPSDAELQDLHHYSDAAVPA
jgi:hypothetical protein